jgi:hypothetical protein
VTNIGDDAFWGCTSLTDVYYYANPTPALLSNWDLDGDDFKAEKATKCHVFDIDDWDDFTNPNVTFVGDLAGKNEFSPVLWGYDNGTQTLTISGTGAMADYNSDNQPWKDFRGDITSVVIEDGVTSIGNNAFKDCTSLTSVTIYAPELDYYGSNAFAGNADGRKIYVFSDCVETYQAKASTMGANVNDIVAIEGIALADAADNSALITAADGYALDVTLQGRTLWKDGDWNTLCLPFDVSITSGTLSGNGVVAMTLDNTTSGLSGTTLTLNFNAVSTTGDQAGLIPAGTPFIIKWASKESPAENLVNPVFNGVTINKATNNVTSTDGKVTFKGTYDARTFTSEDKSILFLGAENTLYWPLAGATIGAQRAYFQLNGITVGDPNAEVREFKLSFGDEESQGISLTPDPSPKGEGSIYTLDGRKLNGEPTKKGMYIVNGKKVVIK